jgi:hypothetical protein
MKEGKRERRSMSRPEVLGLAGRAGSRREGAATHPPR